MKIFVLAEDVASAAALVGGAQALIAQADGDVSSGVSLIALTDEFVHVPSDTIYRVALPEGTMPEDAAVTLSALLTQNGPSLTFVQPTRQLRLLAGKIAALQATTALSDVMTYSVDGTVQHLVYGGAAVCTERATTATQIVFVPAGVLPEQQPVGASSVLPVDFIAPTFAPRLLVRRSRERSSVNLSAAKRVVGVGRGIAEQGDMAMIEGLAAAMAAEVGCTRPIAEEEKWLPREVYIGVSGVILAPELYLAVGLSGQVQHTVGINRAKTIFAINKDKNAPIFKQADYGIVADLYQVVPALTEALSHKE
jgi:electron transfer flavoprotein alpha subunit